MSAALAGFLAAGFLAGSIPTAYLFARALAGTDIRKHGSGNVGATNAFRVLGRGPGLAVFVIDLAKGLLPVLLYRHFHPGAAGHPEAWVGFAAVLGHVFTPFLGFRGGKGMATGAGALLGSVPLIFVLSLPVWGVIFALTRTVSLASLTSLGAVVVLAFFFHLDASTLACFTALCALITWTHRENITRLRAGSENRFINKTKS